MKSWVLILCCLEATASFADESVPPSFAERTAAMDPLSRRFLRPNDDVRPLPAIAGFSPRPVEFDDPSGATLRGALYDRPDTNRLVVLCLGIRGNHTYLLPYARIVIAAGYDALLFDYRGFGSSDGVASAFSLRGDVLAAIDFAVRDGPRSKDDIATFGLSLGSVLALAAAADRDLAAVITEDLWIPEEMLDRLLGFEPSNALLAFARGALERTVLPALDPKANLARFEGPALLLHGDRDPLLPPGATASIAAARPEATRVWFLEGAGHAPESLETHDREYRAQVAAFLDEAFGVLPGNDTRATLDSASVDHAIVSVDASRARFVQITVTDGTGFRHVRRVVEPGTRSPLALRVDAPFRAVRAFATPIHWARPNDDGTFSPQFSRLTADLMRFREVERGIAPFLKSPRPAGSRELGEFAARLPIATAVHEDVRPRYAILLAALATAVHPTDANAAIEIARRAVEFVPDVPEEWVEIASGHFAIGLREERLSRLLTLLAGRKGADPAEAARWRDLAKRVAP